MVRLRRYFRKIRRYYSDLNYRGDVRTRREILSLSKRIVRKPNDPSLYYERASCLSLADLRIRAIADYTRVLELLPEHGSKFTEPAEHVLADRASEYSEHGMWDEAIQDYTLAIAHAEAKPKTPEVHPNDELGEFLAQEPRIFGYSAGRLFAARAECYESKAELSGDVELLHKAIEDLDKAIELQPNWFAYLSRARCMESLYGLTKDTTLCPKALSDIDKAIELDPTPLSLGHKAGTRKAFGNIPEAMALATAVIERHEAGSGTNNSHMAYWLRSDMHAEAGDLRSAIEDHDQSIRAYIFEHHQLNAAPAPPFVDLTLLAEPSRSQLANQLASHHERRAELWDKLGDPAHANEDTQRAIAYRKAVVARPLYPCRIRRSAC